MRFEDAFWGCVLWMRLGAPTWYKASELRVEFMAQYWGSRLDPESFELAAAHLDEGRQRRLARVVDLQDKGLARGTIMGCREQFM